MSVPFEQSGHIATLGLHAVANPIAQRCGATVWLARMQMP